MFDSNCFNCDGELFEIETHPKTKKYKGQEFNIEIELTVCSSCREGFTTSKQGKANTIKLVNAYRERNGLLLGSKLISIRKDLGLSQSKLEELLGVGRNTVIRWEKDLKVQSRSIDVHYRVLSKAVDDPSEIKDLVPDYEFFLEFEMERTNIHSSDEVNDRSSFKLELDSSYSDFTSKHILPDAA